MIAVAARITLSPLAWTREAERCDKLARMHECEYERESARRVRECAKWAREMARRV